MSITMLLEFGTRDTDGGGAGESAWGTADCRLLDLIRRTFPALAIRTSRLEQSGGDHLLLIVNDELAFRFPREGMHDLRLEIEVLRQLRGRSAIQVPAYDHVDPAGRFGGYRFIDGVALTSQRFATLDEPVTADILAEAARFLVLLHSLPQAEVAWTGAWPGTWTASQFADRILTERMPLIVEHAPQLAKPLDAFCKAYRLDRSEHLAIVHGDLVCEHLLIDRAGSSLVGIIDFGDVGLGDPAQDLLGFWSYGPDAAARVIALYDPGGDDPDLLRRSHNHFVRYRVDQLFESLRVGPGPETVASIATVEALLAVAAHYN